MLKNVTTIQSWAILGHIHFIYYLMVFQGNNCARQFQQYIITWWYRQFINVYYTYCLFQYVLVGLDRRRFQNYVNKMDAVPVRTRPKVKAVLCVCDKNGDDLYTFYLQAGLIYVFLSTNVIIWLFL